MITTYIWARYNLLDIVFTATIYNLDKEEMLSAIMSECSWKRTTYQEQAIALSLAHTYLFQLHLKTRKKESLRR